MRVDWGYIENQLRYRIHNITPWCWACANATIVSTTDPTEPVPSKCGWFFQAEHRCAAAAKSLGLNAG